jgi:tetratricopeptide (TPR) repeat protein
LSIEDAADFHHDRACELLKRERHKEAEQHLLAALEIEPRHLQALIYLGDIYTLCGDELGMESTAACQAALDCYDRALAIEWKLAEAWAGKTLTLFYLDRPEDTLAAAESGLFVLPLCVGYGMTCPDIHTNVAEALFDRKVRALLELGRPSEARQALTDGLAYCPGSAFLSRLI